MSVKLQGGDIRETLTSIEAVYKSYSPMIPFAYRMSIGVGAFVLAFLGSLSAGFLTISYQSLKAAFKKPVDELRSE